ncbi:nucleolar complex protein 3 [Kwoniella heveanensis CBS 569]|nr:nucleolar complex protein 3 [Kwoniella heveanensis CBS 569]
MGKPSSKALGKRKAPAPSTKGSNKKPKAGPSGRPAKEDDGLGPTGKPKRKADQPKKVKLRDQKIIPVPKTAFAGKQSASGPGSIEGSEDEDEDFEGLGEEEELDAATAGQFLMGVDENALSRSVKETKRLHELAKSREPIPKQKRQKLNIPAPASVSGSDDYDFDSDAGFDSDLKSDYDEEDDVDFGSGSGSDVYDSGASLDMTDDEDEDEENKDEDDQDDLNAAFDDEISSDEEEEVDHKKRSKKGGKKETEAEYEMAGRSRWAAKPKDQEEKEEVEVGRLPIKLPNGQIQMVEGSTKIALPPSKKKAAAQPPSDSEDGQDMEESEDEGSDDGIQAERMAGQKGKFGRMGIAEIVSKQGWKNAQKLEAAKEMIAALGAEILAGGELVDNGPVLTRLSTFALPTVPSLEDGQEPLPVPASIRGLAFLSQLAVYKDLIPGYRIRQLTEIEEAERVRDEVKRLREGEKMLVRSYKGYLKMLETEIKRRSPLASLSLRCMCELLVSVTHFNFSENIMGVLVGKLGRKGWDGDCDLVLESFIKVFKDDLTGVYTQTLVRLIARMIKERHFQVNPNVLSCLLHLRLRGELDAMKRGKNAKGGSGEKKDDPLKGKKFKSELRKKWATKNQRKKEKEMKEVQKEMAEAEAEVDQEERAQVQTETLKNLFVLYFSILKNPTRTPLLPGALEGISTYAHFINIDFFRDLLAVLRKIIADQQAAENSSAANDDDEEEDGPSTAQVDAVGASQRIRIRLLAIVTAFDILSGQGEALNIDLAVFINQLFALLRPLSLDTGIEDPPILPPTSRVKANDKDAGVHTLSTSALLFRCLNAAFFSRHSGRSPPYRTAAFAKRLTECALHFPPLTAKAAIAFARGLMSKEAKIEGLLDTEERMADGVYKAEMDDPQLVNPFATSLWEAGILGDKYWERGTREEMKKMRDNKAV